MNDTPIAKSGRAMAALIAVVGWWAIFAEVALTLKEPGWKGAHVFGAVWYLSGYFTMLTNLLVAAVMTAVSFNLWPRFAPTLTPTLAFVFVYIVAVSLIYDLLLSSRWRPFGWAKTIDDTLHYTLPLMTSVFWVLWAPKHGLRYRQALYWLGYPLAYLIWIMTRGIKSGWYPYPFLDVSKSGIEQVMLNSIFLAASLLIASLSLVAISRVIDQRKQR
jgi:hypothetical protein